MIYYVMGVSGCGKSTIGQLLATTLDVQFYDGDSFHPTENIEKMKEGIPLSDEDRAGWLKAIHQKAKELNAEGKQGVFACSALKQSYREILKEKLPTTFVYLKGDKATILERMQKREGHFMPSSLLDSQFEILEEPKHALCFSILESPNEIVKKITMRLNEFGLLGLGVMGKSLARNLASNGFKLSLFNRHVTGFEEKVAENFVGEFMELSQCSGFDDLKAFVASLSRPRKIFLMVNAGSATDAVIDELIPFLEKGDIIIDGGNALYTDTERRVKKLEESDIHFLGCGVSGGEEGALKGPSIMPGGSRKAYTLTEKYLRAIAAKDKNGEPCCSYISNGGAGHYVKMVHNGIEYAEMQLIAEVFALMHYGMHRSHSEIADIFAEWNLSDLASYLLEISEKILRKNLKGSPVIDQILDKAGNKGTGSWTTINAAESGQATTLISAALWARYTSAHLEKRTAFHSKFGPFTKTEPLCTVEQIENAYRLARMVNHQQGFELIKAQENYSISLAELSRIWTNGCIIRSQLMEKCVELFEEKNDILYEMEENEFGKSLLDLRTVAPFGIQNAISIPCLTAAVDYLNALVGGVPTAHMIQAQRDFFGAHTFKWKNDPNGPAVHIQWE